MALDKEKELPRSDSNKCPRCSTGNCTLNDARSTIWSAVYICDACEYEYTKPTWLADARDIAATVGSVAAAAVTLATAVGTAWALLSRKEPKGTSVYEFYSRIQVKPQFVSAFVDATRLNRDGARLEPGNLRYDIYRSLKDETQFTLHEIYISEAAASAHKRTDHYLTWNKVVEPMMASKRTRHQAGVPMGYELVA